MTLLLPRSFLPARPSSGCTVYDGRRGLRVLLAATAAVAAFAFGAGPVSAQQRGDLNYGYEAPPGVRSTPSDMGGIGAIPPVGAQERIAARVQARRFDGPRELLRAAAAAVRDEEWGRANELLERAETRVLNTGIGRGSRDPAAGYAGTGPGGAVVAWIDDAREAVIRGERREAIRGIREALARIDDAQMSEGRGRYARDRVERGYGDDYYATLPTLPGFAPGYGR